MKESRVETIKRASHGLRGTLGETLADAHPAVPDDDAQVLKFHGIYQGDDRDARRARRATGTEARTWFMVRAKIPGGRLTAEQYLALDDLAERTTWNRSLRVTTRQGLQLHGVGKGDLRPALQAMHRALVTTLAACGDVQRNVMASPAPLADGPHRAVRDLAAAISRELAPRSGAYHEIWLDGERVDPGAEEEPFYGDTYLPRKFKVAVGLPEDGCLDLYSQDVALVALVERGRVLGYDVLAGGGLGMTHRKADTFARLASPIGSVAPEHAVGAVRVIASIFRDHGNRADRRHARLKYLLEAWGLERFRREVERRADFPLLPWVDVGRPAARELLGLHPQGDGRSFYGVAVPNGRVVDESAQRLKSALRQAVETLRPRVVLTPDQNLLLADLEPGDDERLETILAAYEVPLPRRVSPLRRLALACPALPTCGLALTEAERAMPRALAALEDELASWRLDEEPVVVRMTGCPNGCARPYTADIGIVGSGIGSYDLYVGGGAAGDRLARLWDSAVPLDELAVNLRPLLARWKAERWAGEGLGDFVERAFGAGGGLLTGGKDDPLAARLAAGAAVAAAAR
ncbi:MAG TPA: NADPH-dependent assimilatory sulfite reductase hemoprotein subunit [Thermoanaerobaculia bacterium]